MASGMHITEHFPGMNLALRNENDSDKWSIFVLILIGPEIKELPVKKKLHNSSVNISGSYQFRLEMV